MLAPTTSSRAPRVIRESTFLDDPSLYPEYAALTGKLPRLHAFRCGFHSNRTAVLLALVAVCVALSGVHSPSHGASLQDWIEFGESAMGIDRLLAHFEAFPSAFGSMMVVAALSILVYPLISLVTAMPVSARTLGRSVAVVLVSAAVWGFAVWAQSRCVWGLASGLWFALFCACTTLKIISFAMMACNEPETSTRAPTSIESSSTTGAAAAAGAGATAAATTAATNGSRPSAARQAPAGSPPPSHLLTFREYLFFLFQSPSLVCEVRLMKESARRPSRPLRAASEFFHAVLAFLAAHCVVGSLVAPSMRLYFTWFTPGWVDGAGAGWAELGGAGGGAGVGGWPSWAVGSGLLLEEGKGTWVAVAALLWVLTLVSSCLHFLVFYAFWHCVCLGMAELWGFPDRHLYGCWWLLFDEPKDFLRMWSVPVHRWLLSCVHLPVLGVFGPQEGSGSSNNNKNGSGSKASTENGNGDAKGAIGGVDGTKVGNESGMKAQAPGWLTAVLATCAVSGAFHEAVVYVAMRGSCWPFNTFLLVVAAALVTSWDTVFPLSARAQGSPLPMVPVGNEGGRVRLVRAYGDRGMVSAVMFTALVQKSAFISDCVAWLWWRHTMMNK